MTERDYPEGYDCVWIGSDREGRLAAFVTAAKGPIPHVCLAREQLDILEVEKWIRSLPKTSTARLVAGAGMLDSFVEMAERGLFAYDWSDADGVDSNLYAYELIARPATPLRTGALPDGIARSVSVARLDIVSFAVTPIVDVRAYARCIEHAGTNG